MDIYFVTYECAASMHTYGDTFLLEVEPEGDANKLLGDYLESMDNARLIHIQHVPAAEAEVLKKYMAEPVTKSDVEASADWREASNTSAEFPDEQLPESICDDGSIAR